MAGPRTAPKIEKASISQHAVPSGDDAQVTKAPAETRIGKSVNLNQLRVTPIQVTKRKVRVTKHDVLFKGTSWDKGPIAAETNQEMLIIVCDLQNTSEGQVFAPCDFERLRSAYVEDNFGNRMSPFVPGILEEKEYTVEGLVLDELKPTQGIRAYAIAELPKVENATAFTWTMYFRTSNSDAFNMFLPPLNQAVRVYFEKQEIR